MPAATPTSDPKLKDKLKDVEANIGTLRDQRAEKAKVRDAAKAAFGSQDGPVDIKSDEFLAAQDAVKEVGELDEQIAAQQVAQVELLKMLGQSDDQIARERGVSKDRRNGRDERSGWNSQAAFEDARITDTLTQRSTSKSRFGTLELGEVVSRDMLAADIAPTDDMRRGDYYGVLPQLARPLRILDIIPTGTMDKDTIPYTRESGDFDAGVGEVVEGELKPESGVEYTDATAKAETIATWMKIRKQALADFPALQSIIDNRLRYLVLRRLEGQVLNGNGTEPNLEGILQADGISTVDEDGAELIADQILRGVTKVLLGDADANAVVLNPLDWQETLIAKASSGDGHYYSGGPFSMTPQTLWGVPLVPSRAIPQGTALVGDFTIGAQLFIREGVNVLLSDSDQDDFLRNRITLLGEMRAALVVWRPTAFCAVELEPIGS